jgi:hypothetical protein
MLLTKFYSSFNHALIGGQDNTDVKIMFLDSAIGRRGLAIHQLPSRPAKNIILTSIGGMNRTIKRSDKEQM